MRNEEQRILRILEDSTKEVHLLNDADVDRLLASLASKPVKEHTNDHADILRISQWFDDRYPLRTTEGGS